jgi:hypothetical protein
LRVTGELTSVGGDSLRFEAPELAEVAKLRGHELPAAAASQLESRTQGWAAGIVLMLEHAKLSGQMAQFPDDAAPRAIFDYLAGEIFARFERETQQFLLRIACLPRMSAAVAEGLSGEAKAGRLLLNLALNDYFVSEVAAGRAAYSSCIRCYAISFGAAPPRTCPRRSRLRTCAAPRRCSPPPDRWRTLYRCLRSVATGRRSPVSPQAPRTRCSRRDEAKPSPGGWSCFRPRCSAAMPAC